MSRMSREEFERQAVLHAMGALTPEEARRFEAERARRGTEGESLARGVGQAIARETPSERAALAAVTAGPARRAPLGWVLLSGLLLVGLAAVVVWGLGQRSRAEELAGRVGALDRAADSAAATAAAARAALAAQPPADDVAPLLAATDLVVVPLAGTGGAEGRILAGAGGALLVASGLPALPEGGTYQLWRRTGAVTEPVAALGDAPAGYLLALFSDRAFLEGAQTLLVSAEAGPGRVVPAEPAVLEGRAVLR